MAQRGTYIKLHRIFSAKVSNTGEEEVCITENPMNEPRELKSVDLDGIRPRRKQDRPRGLTSTPSAAALAMTMTVAKTQNASLSSSEDMMETVFATGNDLDHVYKNSMNINMILPEPRGTSREMKYVA